MKTPTAFERERAEGEGAFLGRSIASEKKSVDPLNASEQDNRIQGIFYAKISKSCKKITDFLDLYFLF